MNDLLFTPDGFRDVYFDESKLRKAVISHINERFSLYGYNSFETPALEYENLFNETGTIKSEKLFRFFDKDGKVLSLRPDFTPSIARSGSLLLKNKNLPLRISYSGKVFRNDFTLNGNLRELTQVGCECIGSSSYVYDAELIKIACEVVISLNIPEFNISISHSSIIRKLIAGTELSEDAKITALEFISNKNYFGLAEFLEAEHISVNSKALIQILEKDFTEKDELVSLLSGMQSLSIVRDEFEYLLKIYDILSAEGYDKYISFDFSQVNHMDYYTGIIFSGYTSGTDASVLSGGRYDNLLDAFEHGDNDGAVGFAFDLERLVQAVKRNHGIKPDPDKIHYIITDENRIKDALHRCNELHKSGEITNLILVEDKDHFDLTDEEFSGNELEVYYDR